jgi:hypothetical protein
MPAAILQLFWLLWHAALPSERRAWETFARANPIVNSHGQTVCLRGSQSALAYVWRVWDYYSRAISFTGASLPAPPPKTGYPACPPLTQIYSTTAEYLLYAVNPNSYTPREVLYVARNRFLSYSSIKRWRYAGAYDRDADYIDIMPKLAAMDPPWVLEVNEYLFCRVYWEYWTAPQFPSAKVYTLSQVILP